MAMAVVNSTNNWIYLMEPHTASRAVTEVLVNELGGKSVGYHHDTLTSLHFHSDINWSIMEDPRVYCTVRNPFDVLVTKWKVSNAVARVKVSFEDWVMGNMDHPMVTEPLYGIYEDANYIIRYEDLDNELSNAFKRNLRTPRYNSHKTTKKLAWQTYYSNREEMVVALQCHFKRFLEEYGYHVEYNGNISVELVK